MAQELKQIESPKPWEILGSFFGYFAVAKDIPSILRMLCIQKIPPYRLKQILLRINPSADFWLLITFTAVTVLILLHYLWRTRPIKGPDPSSDKELQEFVKIGKRNYRLRIIRSFGFAWFRDKILDRMNVNVYGTFQRPPPPYWPAVEDRANSIDRIIFADGTGMEFQYAKDFTTMFVRRHTPGTNLFNSVEERLPSSVEIRLLLVASNYFPLWWIMHLIKLPFSAKCL